MKKLKDSIANIDGPAIIIISFISFSFNFCDRFSLNVEVVYPEDEEADPRGDFAYLELVLDYEDGTSFSIYTGTSENSVSFDGIPAGEGVVLSARALSEDRAYSGNYSVVASGSTFPFDMIEDSIAIPLILANRGYIFTTKNNMSFKRIYHRIDGTENGKVVISGGVEKEREGELAIPDIELIDLMNDESPLDIITVGEMSTPRYGHCSSYISGTGTELDGSIVYLGGAKEYSYSGSRFVTDSIEIFDPETGETHEIGEMLHRRVFAECTTLENGKILITGGFNKIPTEIPSEFEIFDPIELVESGNGISSAGDPGEERVFHSVTQIGEGKVLVAGGIDSSGNPLNTALLYSLDGEYVSGITMNIARFGHEAVAVDGTGIIIMGGFTSFNDFYSTPADPTNSAELFDLNTKTFTLISGEMNEARGNFCALPLPSGYIFITGGAGERGYLDDIEYFDPSSFLFFEDVKTSLTKGRASLICNNLSNGMIVFSGGKAGNSGSDSVEFMIP